MLNLITADFTADRHQYVGERIISATKDRAPTLLIVPEQQTLATESEMCDILPPDAPLYFEVTNFTRFVDTVFRTLGGLSGEYATEEDEALTMWRALTELAPLLKSSRKGGRINGAQVKRALGAVKEMSKMGIEPTSLSQICSAAAAQDKRLGDKTEDLALIYALYKSLFNEKYSDTDTNLIHLAKKLEQNPEFLKDRIIFIEGFTSFTEGQYALLSVLVKHCPVHVFLTLPEKEKNAFEFTEVKKTADRLFRIADLSSCEKRKENVSDSKSPLCEALGKLASQLWRPCGNLDNNCLQFINDNPERVRIFEARTPFEECDFIAEDIKKNVLAGDRYSDFAVIARRAEDYAGILDVSLSKRGIPLFISKRKNISSLEAIKLIEYAYKIIRNGFRREDVISYLKSGLTGISSDDRDEFEAYVDRWNVDRERFCDGNAWFMNPRGYSARTERDLEKLKKIDGVRDELITPLVDFRKSASEAKTITEQAKALLDFLVSIKLESSLVERARLLDSLGEDSSAEENARLWELICSALDKIVSALGDLPADAESFYDILSVIFDGKSIGRIPTKRDEVTVGSADTLRTGKKKHVYLIGVNEGEFPAFADDSSYFSKKDKAVLASLGLNVDPDYSVGEARELYCFTRAFTSSTYNLTLLYCARSPSLSPLLVAVVIEKLKNLTKGQLTPTPISAISSKERIYSEEDVFSLAASLNSRDEKTVRDVLCGKDEAEILKISDKSPETEASYLGGEAVALLYGSDVYMSQSRLESYLSCPFKYFLESNLRLSKTQKAEFTSATIGTFVHSVLEKFFLELTEKSIDTKDLSDDDKLAVINRASREYVADTLGENFNPERAKSVVSRLSKAAKPIVDALCEELEHSKFRPVFFELSTSGRKSADASPIIFKAEDGGRIIVQGVVDRVDTFRHGNLLFVRVIDYKTGKKNFTPSDINEGENLQMFLYLKSIVESSSSDFLVKLGAKGGDILLPAGVIYVNASVKDTVVERASDEVAEKTVKESIKRDGMVLNFADSINAMNPEYLPSVTDKRKGTKSLDTSRLYTEEGWLVMCDAMERAVLKIVADMKSGRISPSPKELKSRSGHPCDFCDYKAVCRSPKS